jgi:hypothetical protein
MLTESPLVAGIGAAIGIAPPTARPPAPGHIKNPTTRRPRITFDVTRSSWR